MTTYKPFDDLLQEVQEAIKSKPIVDLGYRKFWQGGYCLIHGKHESTCGHHLINGVQRGQRKASDCFIVPLCWICHARVHENEEEFFRKYNKDIDPREMAWYLWDEWRKKNERM